MAKKTKILVDADKLRISDEQAVVLKEAYPDGVPCAKRQYGQAFSVLAVETVLVGGLLVPWDSLGEPWDAYGLPEKFMNLSAVAIVSLWGLAVVLFLALLAIVGQDDSEAKDNAGLLLNSPLVRPVGLLVTTAWVIGLAWVGSVGWAIALLAAELAGHGLLVLCRTAVALAITKDATARLGLADGSKETRDEG